MVRASREKCVNRHNPKRHKQLEREKVAGRGVNKRKRSCVKLPVPKKRLRTYWTQEGSSRYKARST
jgi:hypothetical protein